jgi:hypothetical protein
MEMLHSCFKTCDGAGWIASDAHTVGPPYHTAPSLLLQIVIYSTLHCNFLSERRREARTMKMDNELRHTQHDHHHHRQDSNNCTRGPNICAMNMVHAKHRIVTTKLLSQKERLRNE